MTGEDIKCKIKSYGFSQRRIASELGITPQALRMRLVAKDVSSSTIEMIAHAMNVHPAYFYDKQPIYSLVDYMEYDRLKRDVTTMRELLAEKERTIHMLEQLLSLPIHDCSKPQR